MALGGSLWIDANHKPVQGDGVVSRKSLTLSGSNTTVASPIFRLTGSVEVRGLYGVVTTALGANNTAAYWRLNDQTAQPAISLATGTTISAAPAGSVIARLSLVSVALSLKSSAAGGVLDPVAATVPGELMPVILVQKTAGVQTDIEFVYSTTDTPTSGVIQFFVRWLPISADGKLVSV